jgi:tetratricopeptide (TPR) repeat protein
LPCDSLTEQEGACTLAEGHGTVIPEWLYPRMIQPSKPHEPARASYLYIQRARPKKRMIRRIHEALSVILLLLVVCADGAYGQASTVPASRARVAAPTTTATIDTSEAMFATMCALYASGYESNISADSWSAFRAQTREQLRAQKGPAVDAIREFYKEHQFRDAASMLSRYVWFALVAGPAPKFQPVLRRDQLPPEVLDLEGFSELLASYYTEQKIHSLWRQVQPLYDKEIERLHDPVSNVLFVASTYLRAVVDPAKPRTFSIIVEPLVGRITNVRSFGDHYSIVLSGSNEIPLDVVRHAYLHFLLDQVPMTYPHVIAVKRPVYELAAKAPRLATDLTDDFPAWFAECTVRAVEVKLKKLSPSEREGTLETADADGLVMVRPMFLGLTGYEQQEIAFAQYFPDLVRAVDVKTEQTRVAAIHFAPAQTDAEAKELNKEDVAKRRARAVTTIPGDQDVIAALTEGEKKIAAQDPRGAEASFQSVLVKYPDQPRAWFGLGLVALLDHDAERAKQVFGRLTTGEHVASKDPMVMAWSHVYLARIYQDEEQLDRAKSEYQAAIDVRGAPVQAQQAAKKGLGDLALRKPSERP